MARTRPDLSVVLAVFEAAAVELAELHEQKVDRGAFDIEIGEGGSVQVVGGKVPAEDQRAYCAALFEAVVGRAPSDSPRWPNTQPAWLGHVVLRGLSPSPSERWTSMRELAEALQDGMRTGRRRWPWLVAVLVIVGLLAMLASDSSCTASVHVTGHPALDEWARAWGEEHESACEEDRSRTLTCLDRVHHRFEVLADAVGDPRLDAAIDALPPPSACADPVLIASEPELPLTAIDADLERARGLASLDRNEAAHALATDALERASKQPILLGRALWTVGALEARLDRPDAGLATMERAYSTLQAAGAERAAGKVALTIASTLAQKRVDPAGVRRWTSRAEAAFEARGATDYERATLERLRSSSR